MAALADRVSVNAILDPMARFRGEAGPNPWRCIGERLKYLCSVFISAGTLAPSSTDEMRLTWRKRWSLLSTDTFSVLALSSIKS